MSWKAALNEYVSKRNQMILDYDTTSLKGFVLDPIYLNMQKQRLNRLSALHQHRSLQVIKHDTEHMLIHYEEQSHEVIIVLQLYLLCQYQMGLHSYIEEKMECEQVRLLCYNGQWYINRIKPELSIHPYNFVEPDFMRVPILYDRNKVRAYADTWWNSFNPNYLFFEHDDCTNFVSQCLFAGNAPMNYTGKRELGWWYQGKSGNRELWSFSWAVADSLSRFLTGGAKSWHAEKVDSPQNLAIGDVISYDWDGNGHYQHSAIVTEMDANGMPLVSAHTNNSKNRYWDYRDSYAYRSQTQYRFFHMPDQF
jgi:hypothetical protein